MQNIKLANANDYTVSGVITVACSFKRDASSTDQKSITLRIHMDKVPLMDIITDASKPKRIVYQNNVARKRFDSIVNGSTVDIDYTSPGKRIETDDEKIAKLVPAFIAAGLDEPTAIELATKSVKNPDVIPPIK